MNTTKNLTSSLPLGPSVRLVTVDEGKKESKPKNSGKAEREVDKIEMETESFGREWNNGYQMLDAGRQQDIDWWGCDEFGVKIDHRTPNQSYESDGAGERKMDIVDIFNQPVRNTGHAASHLTEERAEETITSAAFPFFLWLILFFYWRSRVLTQWKLFSGSASRRIGSIASRRLSSMADGSNAEPAKTPSDVLEWRVSIGPDDVMAST
ncbi:hypothetical protein C8Q75DRAFT_812111 [Abortiporus biennis]|nr:hypothetical protein C8Q75DRAFT_812111 [Abortiporus biennis]